VSAALSLRIAVRNALAADAALLALLGRPAVFDQPPAAAEPPFVLLGDHLCRDASSGGSPAEEHELALEIWSRQAGLKQTLEIAEAIVSSLGPASISAAVQHLVQFVWLSTDARRREDDRFATLRFRALTEPG
jgi:hypothetical protein